MSQELYKVEGNWLGGCTVQAKMGNFTINIDHPVERGGANTGPNPMDLMLASLAGCFTIMSSMVAESMDVKLEDVKVVIKGELDSDGYSGVPGVKVGLKRLEFDVKIKADTTEEKFKELAKAIEINNPLLDTMVKGAQKVSGNVSRI